MTFAIHATKLGIQGVMGIVSYKNSDSFAKKDVNQQSDAVKKNIASGLLVPLRYQWGPERSQRDDYAKKVEELLWEMAGKGNFAHLGSIPLATDANASAHDYRLEGSTLIVPEKAVEKFDRWRGLEQSEQFVLLHEVGHLVNNDAYACRVKVLKYEAVVGTVTYTVSAIVLDALFPMNRLGTFIGAFGVECVAKRYFKATISHEKEYRADLFAVKTLGTAEGGIDLLEQVSRLEPQQEKEEFEEQGQLFFKKKCREIDHRTSSCLGRTGRKAIVCVRVVFNIGRLVLNKAFGSCFKSHPPTAKRIARLRAWQAQTKSN